MSNETPAKPAASMRTPLGRVRFRGSAHSGTSDFWHQRLTAIGMLVLTVPVIIIVMSLLGRNHAAAVQIFGSPLVAILLILFIVACVWHMRIGLQVVIEDYVHNDKLKLVAVLANHFFSAAVALAAIYALVKMSSGV